VHDDTRAFQAALDAARGASGAKAPAVVYVPPGDYLISDTLRVWGFTTVRGCSTSRPTLRLAPYAPGFGNVSALRPLLASTSGWGVNLTAGLPPWWHNTLPSNFLFYQQVHALALDVSAAGNDGVGIAGMTWNTKLLPVVIVNGCSGFEANVATGLIWAADQGANLINMSLQFYLGGTPLRDAVIYAHAQGAVMCAATGNNGNGNIAAPARWSQTIAVAATDNRDIRASFSNFGAETDISAPGVSVWSLAPGGSYAYKSGTSMSVPHVTGLAALLWSADPTLTHLEGRALIDNHLRILITAMSAEERTVMELLSAGKEGEATEDALARLQEAGFVLEAEEGFAVNGALIEFVSRAIVEGVISVKVE
jgi:subtilisin family serine protease